MFTEAELAECSGRVDRVRALAARFAAKEACMKALGVGLGDGVSFQDVEVVRPEEGRPVLRLRGYAEARAKSLGARSVHVSLTHGLATAAAVAVLDG